MGLAKVAFNFMVERGGKLAKSMLCSKPVKCQSLKGLKYSGFSNEVISFKPIIEKNISAFKTDEIIKFASKENKKLGKYFNKSDEELTYLIRENKFTKTEQEEIREISENIKSFWTTYLLKKENIDALKASKEILDKYGEMGNIARAKFIRTFDEVIFPKSKNHKVIDIENKLTKLGIDARLTDHEEIAQNIYNAFKKMHDKGIREFPKVRYSLNKDAINEAIANKMLKDRYVIYSDDILNNINAEKGYFANATIEGTIYHEVGHTLNNVGAGSTLMGDTSSYQKIAMNLSIPQNVSQYSYSLDEFMAEYFSGIMGGKKYPGNITKFYIDNNGYIPPSLKNCSK